MKRTLRVLNAVCGYMEVISDFFEDHRCYRLSKAFHAVYNRLDALHWVLWRRRK